MSKENQQLSTHRENQLSTIFRDTIVPVKKKEKILSEEEYTTSISNIIERDYFPDLPKFENQLSWMVAMEEGDTNKLREIQKRYQKRKRSTTPYLNTPQMKTPNFEATPDVRKKARGEAFEESDEDVVDVQVDVGLDEFLARYTSEDNASFDTIIEKSNEVHREKYKWMYDRNDQQKTLEYVTKKNGGVLGWKYEVRNGFFNNVGLLPSAPVEAKNERKVLKENTRFPVGGIKYSSDEGKKEKNQYKMIGGKLEIKKNERINLEALITGNNEEKFTELPEFNGYKLVAPPTPTPEKMDHIMTWGTIEDTFEIKGDAAPGFSLAPTPSKDRAGRKLAETAEKSMSKRSKKTSKRSSHGGRTPMLSPAAHKLTTALRTPTLDRQLRQSYSTPDRVVFTPRRKTPAPNTPRR